jgi:hypothetical protein
MKNNIKYIQEVFTKRLRHLRDSAPVSNPVIDAYQDLQ